MRFSRDIIGSRCWHRLLRGAYDCNCFREIGWCGDSRESNYEVLECSEELSRRRKRRRRFKSAGAVLSNGIATGKQRGFGQLLDVPIGVGEGEGATGTVEGGATRGGSGRSTPVWSGK